MITNKLLFCNVLGTWDCWRESLLQVKLVWQHYNIIDDNNIVKGLNPGVISKVG